VSPGEPQHALSERRLTRARQHLKSAADLLVHDDFADAISRSYCAIFQAARALLASEQLDSRKHSGVIALFNHHFVKTGRVERQLGVILKDAQRSREMADYSDIAESTRDEAEEQLRDAETSVQRITSLLAGPTGERA